MRILVAGWFSFKDMGATAGDILARDLVCKWLDEAGCAYDVACAPPFSEGVEWFSVPPSRYDRIIFVCGPFGNGPPVDEFLKRFSEIPLIGLNLSMLHRLEEWNPFDVLLERDSNRTVRPDLVWLTKQTFRPVVGMILVHPQREYGSRSMHAFAAETFQRLAAAREMAVIPIDTRLDHNKTGLRTAGEVESLIARMNVVLTTRLHGMVLALKNGVPALVIDPIAGGAKIVRQARVVDWPIVYAADALEDATLERAFEYCLTEDARQLASACYGRAHTKLAEIKKQLLTPLLDESMNRRYR